MNWPTAFVLVSGIFCGAVVINAWVVARTKDREAKALKDMITLIGEDGVGEALRSVGEDDSTARH